MRLEKILINWNESGEDPTSSLQDLLEEIFSFFEIGLETSKKLLEATKLAIICIFYLGGYLLALSFTIPKLITHI